MDEPANPPEAGEPDEGETASEPQVPGPRPRPPRKYLVLLLTLSLLVSAFPFTYGHPIGVAALQIVFIVVIFAIILAVAKSGRHKALAYGFGLVVVAARFAILIFPTLPVAVELGLTALTIVFFAWIIVVLLQDILAEGPVTGDKISGAISVYLLIGFTWGFLYGFVELSHPGSFQVPSSAGDPCPKILRVDPPTPEHPVPREHMIGSHHGNYLFYFSFITFTSTGYGDVIPTTAVARTFSWLEAVFGQFYLAVLVARLVGLQIASSMSSQQLEEKGPGHE